jgi:hypothetical protein
MKTLQRSLTLLSIALLLILSACGTKTVATELTGTLSELTGKVDGKFGAAAEFAAVKAGDILQVNDQVQTGADGKVRIDLSSGTILRVSPSSLFTLLSNESADGGLATKLKLELGRIFIILKGGSMDVDTPSGVASVRGSWMMVEIDPETQDVVITCLEGDCSAGGIDFTDGQMVIFHFDPATGGYRPPSMQNMSEEEFQQWLEENPESGQLINEFLTSIAPLPATPTGTLLPTATATQVGSIVPESNCLNLIAPPDEALLNSTGLITFSWEAKEGAAGYEVTITSPSGVVNSISTTGTSISNTLETFTLGGIFTWQVTALDSSGQPICTATAFTFSKTEYVPYVPPATKTPKPQRPPTFTPTATEVVCTYANAQWTNPKKPCYCNSSMYPNLPPYCMGY